VIELQFGGLFVNFLDINSNCGFAQNQGILSFQAMKNTAFSKFTLSYSHFLLMHWQQQLKSQKVP